MAGDYLLDTNIVSAILDRDPNLAAPATSGKLFVPSIVVGELYYGAANSTRREENLKRVDTYVSAVLVLPCDANTGQRYGDIKAQLRAKGKPIPDNDIWIAAVAFQFELTLATRDGHFGHIEGLRIETW